jgi:NADH-quinone oxidoreductase subunit A
VPSRSGRRGSSSPSASTFVVFDALAVFLVPWLLVLRPLGLPAFWTMAAFVAIIGLGWLYAYREGVLEWK